MAISIERRSPVPFYSQLMQLIRNDIIERGLEPGDSLPGEHRLCEQYGVSRTVVRQALLELEHEGVVRREKGKGTFVGDPRTSRGFGGALVGSFEDIQSQSGEQRSHLLSRSIVPASENVAMDLGLAAGSRVVEIVRVREVDGESWAYTRTHLPLDIGAPLMDVELEDVSLFGLLEREFEVRFERATRSIEAQQASNEVARALLIDPGSPVLVMRSISYDATGRPIERFVGYHRGDRSRLNVEVSRGA